MQESGAVKPSGVFAEEPPVCAKGSPVFSEGGKRNILLVLALREYTRGSCGCLSNDPLATFSRSPRCSHRGLKEQMPARVRMGRTARGVWLLKAHRKLSVGFFEPHRSRNAIGSGFAHALSIPRF